MKTRIWIILWIGMLGGCRDTKATPVDGGSDRSPSDTGDTGTTNESGGSSAGTAPGAASDSQADLDVDADRDSDADSALKPGDDSETVSESEGDCLLGETQCRDLKLYRCSGEGFELWDDCTVQGMVCAVIQGVPQCYAPVDRETDTGTGTNPGKGTDTGTNSEWYPETDSGTGTVWNGETETDTNTESELGDTLSDSDWGTDTRIPCPYSCLNHCNYQGGTDAGDYACPAGLVCCAYFGNTDSQTDSETGSDTGGDDATDTGTCQYTCSLHCLTVGGSVMDGECPIEGYKCCDLGVID